MKAVILAAGMGTRLGTLIPKPLTSIVDEKTIMDFQIEHLSPIVGLNNIIAVVGYKKELIMERFPEITFVYNPAYAHTNTSKSLLAALEKVDDDVIWMNGDVYFQPTALRQVAAAETSGMLVDTKKCGDEEIKYTTNKAGDILELSKQVKGASGEAVGINIVKRDDLPRFCAELANVENQDYFEKALENLTRAGRLALRPIYLDDAFCQEIDFAEDLKQVRAQAYGLTN
jgi:L-glutamine-phosphate cytidylyltransferase